MLIALFVIIYSSFMHLKELQFSEIAVLYCKCQSDICFNQMYEINIYSLSAVFFLFLFLFLSTLSLGAVKVWRYRDTAHLTAAAVTYSEITSMFLI